jgi:hypothetical protein
LVQAVKALQSETPLGDDLWKAWVEQFGSQQNDPAEYSAEFLLEFIRNSQAVEFTEQAAELLAAEISAGTVKRDRALRQPPCLGLLLQHPEHVPSARHADGR